MGLAHKRSSSAEAHLISGQGCAAHGLQQGAGAPPPAGAHPPPLTARHSRHASYASYDSFEPAPVRAPGLKGGVSGKRRAPGTLHTDKRGLMAAMRRNRW